MLSVRDQVHRATVMGPRISRASHARASRQSRITVCGETWSASAVSSTLRPPKNRSSTTCARRGSIRVRLSSASSRAQSDEALDSACGNLIQVDCRAVTRCGRAAASFCRSPSSCGINQDTAHELR